MSDLLVIAAWFIGILIVLSWLGIAFVGAPYVPTRAKDLEKIFITAQLKKKDVLVDLGSGDGRLQLMAARHGVRSVGYELNFFLVVISWVRLWSYRALAQTRLANFWKQSLPADTTVVFTFLAGPFMKRLVTYLELEAKRLKRPLLLVSYGFQLPERSPIRQKDAVLVYEIKP